MFNQQTIRMIWVLVASAGGMVAIMSFSEATVEKEAIGQSEIKQLLDQDEMPPLPSSFRAAKGFSPDAIGNTGKLNIDIVDKKSGRLSRRFSYDRMTPRDAWVFDVVRPEAWLYVSDSRVIHLVGDKGQFYAPGNQPQEGTFRKNLVITIYQKSKTRVKPLDLGKDSMDRAIKIKLFECKFNTVTGRVQSKDDVEVMTPATKQAHFKGRGLDLVYDEANRRIKYLEIAHGKSLRYHRLKQPKVKKDPKVPPKPQPRKKPTTPEKKSDEPFYQLTFDRNVVARNKGRLIKADRLLAYFTLDRESTERQLNVSAPVFSPMALSPSGRLSWYSVEHMAGLVRMMASEVGGSVPNPLDVKAKVDPDAMPHRENDVVLTWTGKMTMIPVETPPQELAGPKDMYVRFEGRPVRVEGDKGERLECHMLEYLDSQRRILANGSALYPMVITSPQLGKLTADRFALWLDDVNGNRGRLIGAGVIAAPKAQAGAKKTKRDSSLPEGFRVEWNDRVDLVFVKREKDYEANANEAKVDEGENPHDDLKSASFVGKVEVFDRDFHMKADRLTTHFTDQTIAGKERGRGLKAIDAEGAVHATFNQGYLEANKLHITTKPNENGKLVPAMLTAHGRVKVVDPKQHLEAGHLEATFAEKPKDSKDKKDSKEKRPESLGGTNLTVDVHQITAFDQVVLKLRNGTVVLGDKLEADSVKGEATVVGAPVRIQTSQNKKVGKAESELRTLEVDITRNGKHVLAKHPGEYVFTEPDDPGTGENEARRVKVVWKKRMVFDDLARTIDFFGKVQMEAEDVARTPTDPIESNTLSADRVTLFLRSKEVMKAATSSGGALTKGKAKEKKGFDAAFGQQSLRRMVAVGNVRLQANKYKDKGKKFALTRFMILGPKLDFVDLQKVATVTGAGKMLIEDYRPKPKPDKKGDGKGKKDSTVAKAIPMSGRGATLFTWTEKMVMEGEVPADGPNRPERSRLRMEGKVQMTHEPLGTKDVLELKTDALLCEMNRKKNLKSLGMTKVDNMDINFLDATGGVFLRDNKKRAITCDQLLYNGLRREALLLAPKERWVEVIRFDNPKPLRAKTILWDLNTDTLDIRDAGR